MGLRKKAEEALQRASTCPNCGHSESAGIPGCSCPNGNCACG